MTSDTTPSAPQPANGPHGTARWLPAVFFTWIPELHTVTWPEESRATCGDCPLLADRSERFNPETRCCTYHPTVPNFLVGHGLLRGGVSREVLLRRIATGDGVDASGIKPPKGWSDLYFSPSMAFGRDRSMRCPYWVGGEESCGIWADRNATCRTWFCKHDDGVRGQRLWTALRESLQATESALAAACVRAGGAPGRHADVSEWAAWFELCAQRVDAMSDAPPPDTETYQEQRRKIAGALEAIATPIPDLVVPNVQDAEATEDGFLLRGYSRYDRFLAPPTVMTLLAALDGVSRWRELPDRDDLLILGLWRAGLLVAP
jgi:hypothetical protein